MSEGCCHEYLAVPLCTFRKVVQTAFAAVDANDMARVDEFINQFDRIRRTYVDDNENKENENPQQ